MTKTALLLSSAILLDGSNVDDAPGPKSDLHICNQVYTEIEDFEQDLFDVVATCQRHTRCSAAYCLRTCHGYKWIQDHLHIV